MKDEKIEDNIPSKLRVTLSNENTGRSMLMKGKSDSEIWKAFKQGNEGAFNYIYHTHFKSLYNFGCQLHADQEVIKDLLQDFFIDLRARSEYTGEVKYIKAYLFKALKRRVQEYKRKIKRIPRADYREFNVIFSTERQLINKQLNEEKTKLLTKALNTLTKRQREVIFYYFYEGMSYEEIATTMEISNVKSVRNLVYKSLNVMRRKTTVFDKLLFTLI